MNRESRPPLKPPSSVRRPAGVAVVARQARVPRGVLPAPLRGRHRRQGAAPHDAAAADCGVSQHTFINDFVKHNLFPLYLIFIVFF